MELFGPTIRTGWQKQNSNLKDELIRHMIYLFGETFNKKVVLKLVGDGLKYTRAQYRGKLVDNPKHERPPMVPEQEWKALMADAKFILLRNQGKQPRTDNARYMTYNYTIAICSILFYVLCQATNHTFNICHKFHKQVA